jgi:hypothetical protein
VNAGEFAESADFGFGGAKNAGAAEDRVFAGGRADCDAFVFHLSEGQVSGTIQFSTQSGSGEPLLT